MHRFRVWAPGAAQVDLLLEGAAHPMTRAAQGNWELRREAPHGARYQFSLDGGPARPDPRSQWQPDGVHGASAVVDHGAFRWSDNAWRGLPLRGAILYELHVGTFSPEGTFEGAIERLDHLVSLGIDAIELLPVCEFSGDRGWGYDGVDLFAPHHAYGGPEGLKRLVDACHARGIAVVIDVVYNHLGPAGNYLAEFGPYFTDRHTTGWGEAINYDGPGSDEVRRFVLDNACGWLRDYHCDGLRLDAVHAIVDQSALHVLEQLAREVRALSAHLRRPLWLIAESDRADPRTVHALQAGGLGLDAAWADEWHHALHAVLTGETNGYYADFGDVASLAKALRQAWVYDGLFSPHRRRVHGRPPDGLSGDQFVVFAQNHDQVGNRAQGDRLSALTSAGRLHIAAALLLTGPFTPLLFQGEEWGATTPFLYFTDHADPALGEAVRSGRQREFAAFGWDPDTLPDPQALETFERSCLDWSQLEHAPHAELLDFHRQLIQLRRRHASLSDPRLSRVQVQHDAAAGWLLVQRGGLLICAHLGAEALRMPVEPGCAIACASSDAVTLRDDVLHLPPDSVAVLEHGKDRDSSIW